MLIRKTFDMRLFDKVARELKQRTLHFCQHFLIDN